jgi:two-component system, LytTR family, response regulator
MISCVIVDDEPFARKLLEDFLQKVPGFSLAGSYSSALKALEVLQKKKVDVIFIDVQMPDISGIEFLKTLEKKPLIVLTTAYAEFALEGFDLDAADYLLKPFDFQRFLKATHKITARLTKSAEELSSEGSERSEYMFIKDGTKLVKVKLSEIQYIKGLREYVTVHTADKKIMSLQSMKNLEQELPDYFARVHNSYIISLHAIQTIGKGEIEVAGEKIPIGITYKKSFQEKLNALFPGSSF